MVHAGCFFVADIHSSRTWMSGSFESVRWIACVQRLDLGLSSHSKEFWGKGVRNRVNSKGKNPLYRRFRGGSNPRATLYHSEQRDQHTTDWAIPAHVFSYSYSARHRLFGLVVKASASRAGDPGFKSRLLRDFNGVESYQWLKNWHSSGYPARRLAI